MPRMAGPGNSTLRSQGVPRPARPTSHLASARRMQGQVMDEPEVIYDEPSIVMDESEVYEDGEVYYEDEAAGHCSSCGDTGCTSCGVTDSRFGFDLCDPTGGNGGRQLCIRLPSHGWVSVDYLGWFASGMNLPPLVTTSPTGTAQAAAGVLPNASVLFGGNNDALTDTMNGTRVRVGLWSSIRPNYGAEGEYFGFGQQSEMFDSTSSGSPILARPFYNNNTGLQDSELVAFPGLLSGRVTVEATSQLTSAAVRFRHILCCSSKAACSPWDCGPIPAQSRIDATLGWRYMQLDEGLSITENLASTDANNPGSFLINDSFTTFNQFNGAEFGFQWLGRRGYWSLDTLLRLNVGNTLQSLTIAGTTKSPVDAAAVNGGLLAQPGRNSGSYSENQFGVVPEVGTTIGYQLTKRLKINVGYSALYWSNVLRPGDQIDSTVNTNLLPPPIAGTAYMGPGFVVRDTDYWVQGLSVGGEYRW